MCPGALRLAAVRDNPPDASGYTPLVAQGIVAAVHHVGAEDFGRSSIDLFGFFNVAN
jgi:hypothetical protein